MEAFLQRLRANNEALTAVRAGLGPGRQPARVYTQRGNLCGRARLRPARCAQDKAQLAEELATLRHELRDAGRTAASAAAAAARDATCTADDLRARLKVAQHAQAKAEADYAAVMTARDDNERSLVRRALDLESELCSRAQQLETERAACGRVQAAVDTAVSAMHVLRAQLAKLGAQVEAFGPVRAAVEADSERSAQLISTLAGAEGRVRLMWEV